MTTQEQIDWDNRVREKEIERTNWCKMIFGQKDKRIRQRETDLILKVKAGLLTWGEAGKIMERFLRKIGY